MPVGGVSVGALTPYLFFWGDDTLYEVCGNRDGDVCGLLVSKLITPC
jgi:hypothetical protein